MRRLFVLVAVLVLGFSISGVQSVAAQIYNCDISPGTTVQQGTILNMYMRADQSTTRFSIDGQAYGEFAGPENRVTYDTAQLSPGNHRIGCHARYSGGWEQGESTYRDITITAAPGGQPRATTGGVDFDGYCRAIGYVNWRVNPNNAYTVTCYQDAREDTLDQNDLYALCAWQYGGQLPYPGLNATGDPNSWSCNAAPTYISPPFTEAPAQPIQPPQSNPPQTGGSSGGSSGSSGGSSSSSGSGVGSVRTTSVPNRGSGAACYAPEPVGVGAVAQITPGTANRMRSGAGLGYTQVGTIPGGGTIDIIGGPVCSDGYRWWEVRYNGTTGWTADGDDREYWMVTLLGGGGTSQNQGGGGLNVDDIEFGEFLDVDSITNAAAFASGVLNIDTDVLLDSMWDGIQLMGDCSIPYLQAITITASSIRAITARISVGALTQIVSANIVQVLGGIDTGDQFAACGDSVTTLAQRLANRYLRQ